MYAVSERGFPGSVPMVHQQEKEKGHKTVHGRDRDNVLFDFVS